TGILITRLDTVYVACARSSQRLSLYLTLSTEVIFDISLWRLSSEECACQEAAFVPGEKDIEVSKSSVHPASLIINYYTSIMTRMTHAEYHTNYLRLQVLTLFTLSQVFTLYK